VTKFSFIHDMHCIICEKQLLYRCSTFAVFYGNQIHKLAVNVTSNNIDVSNLTWISSRYSFRTIFCALCYCLKQTSCAKPFHLFVDCFPVWCWLIQKFFS